MKKLIVMLVAVLMCMMLLAGCGGSKGHVKIQSTGGFTREYDFVIDDNGDEIRYNETITYWE